ncbi:Haem-degrading [Saccharopolyspora antimicrobica]|uniref:Haem-degrading n=1 Tax=Saccharopolyspora antimicrobica TaxID=455193 RepID=A0A1I4VZG5_9PSEU|nr:heme-binding protein [Saccharopolyspora antimicrobica]RKT87141.1 heme-degrading protein [Saccharopolyspora antimicrobica]SFN06622.1 Haem-degrading [Saccharopolyspora antimicrobica]
MLVRARSTVALALLSALSLTMLTGSLAAQGSGSVTSARAAAKDGGCAGLPTHDQLRKVVSEVVRAGGNGGLGHDMWAAAVNRDGIVCAVAFSGPERDSQWPGSRIIAAQKAHTANAFSLPPGSRGALPGLSLSTANLYSAVQPGGSLYGLQHSNPVDPAAAYSGDPAQAGRPNDPLVGQKIGGVNVFGGGLALYTRTDLIGGLGVSGDTSCTDHVVAWKMRDALKLDHVPTGVRPRPDGDNIIHDIQDGSSASGFGHPTCFPPATDEAAALPSTHPLG